MLVSFSSGISQPWLIPYPQAQWLLERSRTAVCRSVVRNPLGSCQMAPCKGERVPIKFRPELFGRFHGAAELQGSRICCWWFQFQLPSLVNVYIIYSLQWKDPPCYFHGKIHYFDWAIFNSFLYVHQRVSIPGMIPFSVPYFAGGLRTSPNRPPVQTPAQLVLESGPEDAFGGQVEQRYSSCLGRPWGIS